MAVKKSSKPQFTVQTKVTLIADVTVEAASIEEALALGKSWTRRDVVKMDDAASECDSRIEVVGCYSQSAWSVAD